MEYLETVDELNSELYDKVGETEDQFYYSTNGYVDVIGFGNEMLWNSEMDGRKFDEETDNYEPFTPYIKRVFNEWCDKMQTFRF
jgi:hypothetical protein